MATIAFTGAGVCTCAFVVAAGMRIASERDIEDAPAQQAIIACTEASGAARGQQSASHVAPRPAKSIANAASISRLARIRFDVPFVLMTLQTRNISVHYTISARDCGR